jgi:hypothetical protein
VSDCASVWSAGTTLGAVACRVHGHFDHTSSIDERIDTDGVFSDGPRKF